MVPTESQMTSTDGSTIQAISSFTFTAVSKGGAAGVGGGVNALQPTTSTPNGTHRRTIRVSSPVNSPSGILVQAHLFWKHASRLSPAGVSGLSARFPHRLLNLCRAQIARV